MRIISGKLGGQTFQSPPGHRTHPMSERIRGAIFNMLGDIDELTVLDAFAGSGALGLEAISRGASHVVAIDIDKTAVQTIKQNTHALGIARNIKVIRANAGSWSGNNPKTTFDIVLLDPPYDAVKPHLLAKLAGHAKPSGIIIVSLPPGPPPDLPTDIQLVQQKDYGDAQILAYRKI